MGWRIPEPHANVFPLYATPGLFLPVLPCISMENHELSCYPFPSDGQWTWCRDQLRNISRVDAGKWTQLTALWVQPLTQKSISFSRFLLHFQIGCLLVENYCITFEHVVIKIKIYKWLWFCRMDMSLFSKLSYWSCVLLLWYIECFLWSYIRVTHLRKYISIICHCFQFQQGQPRQQSCERADQHHCCSSSGNKRVSNTLGVVIVML